MPAPPSKPRADTRLSVALLIETSNAYSRELLQGIRDYVHERSVHAPWSLILSEQGRGSHPPPWIEGWRGHGIIARIETEEIASAVRRAQAPVVNVSAAEFAPEFPAVISDSAEVARLAFEHLRERGLRHFGYCGDARFSWARKHGENFAARAAAAGFYCDVFAVRRHDFAQWAAERRRLIAWLRALPKPAGVMACYDIRGQQVLDVCREIGLAVPEEIAVIGQHNDELLCELCDPPLSSVIPNPRRGGYEAAALLDRGMRGRPLGNGVIKIPPVGIATRRSTDLVAMDDPALARAVRYIRDHVFEGINVEDVLRAAPMSRSLLERKFKSAFGRTPHAFILNLRIEQAKNLLRQTELSIAEVAERAGFAQAEYFSSVFRLHAGSPPGAFRRQARAASRGRGKPAGRGA